MEKDRNKYLSVNEIFSNKKAFTQKQKSDKILNGQAAEIINDIMSELVQSLRSASDYPLCARMKDDEEYSFQEFFAKMKVWIDEFNRYPDNYKDAEMRYYINNLMTVSKVMLDCTDMLDIEIVDRIFDENKKQPYFIKEILDPKKDMLGILEFVCPETIKQFKLNIQLSPYKDIDLKKLFSDSNLSYDEQATFVNDVLTQYGVLPNSMLLQSKDAQNAIGLDDETIKEKGLSPFYKAKYSDKYFSRAKAKIASGEYSIDEIIEKYKKNKEEEREI